MSVSACVILNCPSRKAPAHAGCMEYWWPYLECWLAFLNPGFLDKMFLIEFFHLMSAGSKFV